MHLMQPISREMGETLRRFNDFPSCRHGRYELILAIACARALTADSTISFVDVDVVRTV